MLDRLPWRWISVLLIIALFFTARGFAGSLGRADAAAERVEELEVDLASIEDTNESLEEALADADSSKAERARSDSVRIAALDLEADELARTVRNLEADDLRNAESVDVALRDLGALLSPGAIPALRQLQSAYGDRVTGLSDQIVALTGIVEVKDEEIEILEAELGAERFARSAADRFTAGLRAQIVALEDISDTKSIEIDALRSAIAPGFFLRLWQNAGLAVGAAAVGATVAYVAFGG